VRFLLHYSLRLAAAICCHREYQVFDYTAWAAARLQRLQRILLHVGEFSPFSPKFEWNGDESGEIEWRIVRSCQLDILPNLLKMLQIPLILLMLIEQIRH
jgi:hypothetical protein